MKPFNNKTVDEVWNAAATFVLDALVAFVSGEGNP